MLFLYGSKNSTAIDTRQPGFYGKMPPGKYGGAIAFILLNANVYGPHYAVHQTRPLRMDTKRTLLTSYRLQLASDK
ncbi:hypothetical protein [Chryseobacterium camelliae]|uniref:hypothetical protein n=1 Tax=Chryseobacterium camelliae TaxID=1265445 RepID=UPI00285B9EC1|nr:hypothetical protein [Chryseobacterium camelliae]MDR6517336.1 hypothetical protein [Chryseobacterium camelliae]